MVLQHILDSFDRCLERIYIILGKVTTHISDGHILTSSFSRNPSWNLTFKAFRSGHGEEAESKTNSMRERIM